TSAASDYGRPRLGSRAHDEIRLPVLVCKSLDFDDFSDSRTVPARSQSCRSAIDRTRSGGSMKNLGSVFAAYVIGWAIFFIYYVTIARRTAKLRDEIERLRNSLNRGK